jgi:hypothetical protein
VPGISSGAVSAPDAPPRDVDAVRNGLAQLLVLDQSRTQTPLGLPVRRPFSPGVTN